jgi:hypothetical protein
MKFVHLIKRKLLAAVLAEVALRGFTRIAQRDIEGKKQERQGQGRWKARSMEETGGRQEPFAPSSIVRMYLSSRRDCRAV